MNSRLDSSIAQILGLDNDGRRKALIEYISTFPAPIRAAMIIPDDLIDPTNATRNAALLALQGTNLIDPAIMIDGGDPETTMIQRRDVDGLTEVPSLGGNGKIEVTTDFSVPNEDIYLKSDVAPFTFHYKWGESMGGLGSSYWPVEWDKSPELTIWKDVREYQKLNVIYNMGKTDLLWVRIK